MQTQVDICVEAVKSLVRQGVAFDDAVEQIETEYQDVALSDEEKEGVYDIAQSWARCGGK